MNNIMVTKTNFIMSKEFMSLIKNGGKYGCIMFGIYALHDLFIGAMEKGYAFNATFNSEGKVGFNFTPSIVIEK